MFQELQKGWKILPSNFTSNTISKEKSLAPKKNEGSIATFHITQNWKRLNIW